MTNGSPNLGVNKGEQLKATWNKAARLVNDARRFLLPEDLLHALTEDPDARLVLLACGTDFEELRSFLVARLKVLPAEWAEDGKPPVTEGTYNSIWGPMDRAIRLAAAAGHGEATGAHLLLAS